LANNNRELFSYEYLKALHFIYIRELYKDREAPIKPFDRELGLATCSHCLDREKRFEFLKEWVGGDPPKSCKGRLGGTAFR